ncbi:hypothetical protein GQ53DRAFT_836980 [Thozetella sp. PMI_491]|nr:hypothetical protein GQ53DRAFT_836980 [Thozetella sp. PMI_491]
MAANTPRDIAIIGSGCRFPGGANSPSKLWELLRSPRGLSQPIPSDRFSVDGFYHENAQYHGHMNVKQAYFLAEEGVHRRFDASFFGMNPAEAMCLDPQCRLLLETVYEALEAAGLAVENLRGSDTAVYTGQMVSDYEQIMTRDTDDSTGNYHASGTSRAILSNRISYFFDWHGPSMTIDTACSSSLVALHQAVQQLRTGQSRVAVATGANLLLDAHCFISLSSLNMLSPDGRSRMWDAGANGYARGEGVAAVVLKTLSAALEDGDDIECIIRETGFAQDGKTQGITSPNPVAQAQLIRDCYARAGLDVGNPAHRPQYFECHGTGTLAGDAAEAEAVSTAFFPSKGEGRLGANRLLVGSIKSVIGHTEGTAGIAGILKASLALQNATVPPNLLFNRLSPRVEPFYSNLQVSTTAAPWPSVPDNVPRRASVNSFGFGGAIVHAILESYTPATQRGTTITTVQEVTFAPFVFSAFSRSSLITYMTHFRDYLQSNMHSISLHDLSYTLHSRRTCFRVATSITASSAKDLLTKLTAKIESNQEDTDQPIITRISRYKTPELGKHAILGVFTGQGAQWPGMGSQLLASSKAARHVIARLEFRLSRLPPADRPAWSLLEELQREGALSRLSEAEISQPLCTAVQILQVDLLRAAGVEFSAVVGHSSGEIAAAYAAGFISAEDAICIAYYRGLHSKAARGPGGILGAMMAVSTSAEDAQELCNEPEFEGRVCIAAINSPSSVTLSGDHDGIEEMKVIFEDEKKFVRALRVDKAYHSHHMVPCSAAYIESLAALEIKIDSAEKSTWFSSVLSDGPDMSGEQESLRGVYWNRNLVSPVLFQQAITNAWTAKGPFDMAIEIGPHPSLKSPALETLEELSGQNLPYTGLFRRGISAVESVASALGRIWACLGGDSVNLRTYEHYLSGGHQPKLVKGLPTYAWDHENDYWNESRYAKAFRTRPDPVHELLGHMMPGSNDQDMRWRHVLRPSEIPWLIGHQLQDQIVFPAAGYVVTALEAAMALCRHRGLSASLIELTQMEFGRALVFDASESGVEIIVSIADIIPRGGHAMDATFKYHAGDGGGDSGGLGLFASGCVRITLGEPSDGALPPRLPRPPNLIKVQAEDFYSASKDLDYQWAGPFVALDGLERKLGAATGYLNIVEPSKLSLHPAILDAAFQGVLLAYSYPEDGQLWTIHVPRRIQRLTVNPGLLARGIARGDCLPFDSSHHPDTLRMIGNVDVYPGGDVRNAAIQVEGLECLPLSRATAQDDKEAFATMIWDVASPDIDASACFNRFTAPKTQELSRYLERMAGFYVRAFERNTAPTEAKGHHAHLLQFASEAISSSRAGQVPLWCPDWENDSHEQLMLAGEAYADVFDVQLLRRVGETLSTEIQTGDSAIVSDRIPTNFYTESLGPRLYHEILAQTVKQLAHRDPHMNILQIGAGAGAATESVLGEIGSSFSTYTLIGASSESPISTKPWMEPHLHKMIFKSLDASLGLAGQDLAEQSYDLVIASLALSTAPDPEQMLQNIRRLLRPGGRLIALELLPARSAVYGLIFGVYTDWWLRPDGSRVVSGGLDSSEWDALLKKTGFSGYDTATPEMQEQSCLSQFSVFVSQAMDDQTAFLRDPLSSTTPTTLGPATLIQDLVLISGTGTGASYLLEQTRALLHNYCGNIRTVSSLIDLSRESISLGTSVMSLVDLDEPVFQEIDEARWEALKKVAMSAGLLLWVSRGRRADNPYANMMLGFLRSTAREIPTLTYQMLDIEDTSRIEPYTLAEAMLRLQAQALWRRQASSPIRITVENELVLDKHGRLLIPRLVMNKDMNDRYNSLRRPVSGRCNPTEAVNVVATSTGTVSSYKLHQEPVLGSLRDPSTLLLDITHSLLSAIRVAEFGCMFLVLGKDRASSKQLIALSSSHKSVASPLNELSVAVEVSAGSEAAFLALVMNNLLASITLRGLSVGDVVLASEPSHGFASALEREAKTVGAEVAFITTKDTGASLEGSRWMKVHPGAPDRVISSILPTNPSVFVDFETATDNASIGDRIRSQVPAYCRRDSLEALFSTQGWTPPRPQVAKIHTRLSRAVASALSIMLEASDNDLHTTSVILPKELPELDRSPVPYSVIDWTQCTDVQVMVRPIDRQITFTDQKTYWLAGLSGGLGLSLCEWMARHGAKYFVISSRRPNIDASWLEKMRVLGTVVKVAACDITARQEVVDLYAEICATMPPVAGVAQGAMVLEDRALREMTLSSMLRGTRPKVEGSVHLNDLFQENTLDFFIFFSSVVSVIGRPGQANYCSANTFMGSLAQKRRQRGLAASIIHIGAICGVGYAAQLEKLIFTKSALLSSGLISTSERDFYQLFAEAVIAGRPGSSSTSIELFSGARRVSPQEQYHPVWEAETLMSHFLRNPEEISQRTSDNQSQVSVKTQLAQARDRGQVLAIIQDAFLEKLRGIFQIDLAQTSNEALAAMRLDEMGIDSLLAVEIRGWFMKTLEVNVPVLKILGGAVIGSLVSLAAEGIPERLIPGLQVADEATSGDSDPDSSFSQGSSTHESSTAPTDTSRGSSVASDLGSVDKFFERPRTPSALASKAARLSFSQEMFWFVSAFLKDKTSLNHTAWARITGNIRVADFQRAVRVVGQQHEAFRTCIVEQDGKPMQTILETSTLHLELAQIQGQDEVQKAVRMLQDHHVYDLKSGQAARVMLLSRSPEDHYFVAGLHPLVADGTSFQTLVSWVQRFYSHPEDNIHAHRVRQFSEYSEKQHADFVAGRLETDLQFWKAELTSLPPPLPILTLSTATSRPALDAYENEQVTLRSSAETKRQIQDVCRRYRATPFHFYLAVFRVLLLLYAPAGEGEDAIIGIGDANRTEDYMMDVIGPFVNILPLRLRAQSSVEFAELLQNVRDRAYAALAHSKLPFQVLLNELEISRSSSYSSLFQAFINYRQGLRETTRWGTNGELTLHSLEIGIPKLAYDLSLEIVDHIDGDCHLTLVTRKSLYGQAEAQRLLQSYERLLKAFTANPSLLLHQADLFDTGEVEHAMKLGRGLSVPAQWPETIIHRVDQITHTQPHDIAVRYANKTFTYAEISEQAIGIATMLHAADVGVGSTVAVLQEPSPAWVASLLAIMRLGAVYLPLDPGLPSARLATMVRECKPPVMLVASNSEQLVKELETPGMRAINVSNLEQPLLEPVPISAVADRPAAILYTSGASGTPKGVVLKHDGLRNWAEQFVRLCSLGKEVVLQQTSPSFDLSLAQVFAALCQGGSLCLVPREHRGDPEAIYNIFATQGVTFTGATPSEYAAWLLQTGRELKHCAGWTKAISVGEPLAESLVAQFSSLNKPDFALYNLYGPTEISFSATGLRVPLDSISGRSVAAGHPHPNYSIYVVDEQLNALPVGVQGEICVGGAGVSLGYFNKPGLTAERFIPNLFATAQDGEMGWDTLYRTGDLGRWQQDGTLQVEGRISGDTQVKLRGLRVDLAEIESVILDVSDGVLRGAIVSACQLSPDKPPFLVAHVEFDHRTGEIPNPRIISTIRSRLSNKLPQYMCPSFIMLVDKLPLTASGKLDRKMVSTLPIPIDEGDNEEDEEREKNNHAADTAAQLEEIWQQIIGPGRRRIVSDTDFFHIGGSSLLLISLRAQIKEVFGANIPLVRMFESSTLGAMAQLIDHEIQHKPEIVAIDWQRETELPLALEELEYKLVPKRVKAASPRIVVLTGATGTLGAALLAALVKDPSIEHVHCLAVRNSQDCDNLPAAPDRYTMHEGDLVLPHLGLPDADAAAIFSTADAIIHSGADVSWLKTYGSMRAANLQSTKELIKMCALYAGGRIVPFHYVSTVSVGQMVGAAVLEAKALTSSWGEDVGASMDTYMHATDRPTADDRGEFVFRPGSVAAYPPPSTPSLSDIANTAHGYVSTKWASEVFLERLHEKYPEWPVVIHRPSLIMPRGWNQGGGDGSKQNDLDLVETLRRYSTLLHAVPTVRGISISGCLDVVYLEEAVQAIVGALWASMQENSTGDERTEGVQFLHHVDSLQLQLSDLQQWAVEQAEGQDVEEIEVVKWAEKAGALGMHPTMVAIFQSVAAAQTGHMVLPRVGR